MSIEQDTAQPGSGGSGEPGDPVEIVLAEIRRRGGASPRRAGSSCGLCPASRPPDSTELAEDLARQVHAYGLDVHMSTIYRFLDELEELGVVSHSHLGHGPAVYDISPVGHFHLVCEVCGAVTETPDALLAAAGVVVEGALRLFYRSPPFCNGGPLQEMLWVS